LAGDLWRSGEDRSDRITHPFHEGASIMRHCTQILFGFCSMATLGFAQPTSVISAVQTDRSVVTTSTAGLLPTPPVDGLAEQAWQKLAAQLKAPDVPEPTHFARGDTDRIKADRHKQAVKFAGRADDAKEFYTRFPQHPKAVEARKHEALALMQAVRAGDASLKTRTDATVQAFRRDKSVPVEHRVEVVGTYGFSQATSGNASRAERLVALEQVARGLVAEFPTQSQGYESLLTVANASDNEKGRSLANELLASESPPAIKQRARLLIAQLELVGQSLATLLAGVDSVALKAALKNGKPTLIYAWILSSPGSIKLAQRLAKTTAVSDFNLFGVSLDQDTVAASQQAASEQLPGILIYDQQGPAGLLATTLKLTQAPQVFFADGQGILRDVHGTDDITTKLARYEQASIQK